MHHGRPVASHKHLTSYNLIKLLLTRRTIGAWRISLFWPGHQTTFHIPKQRNDPVILKRIILRVIIADSPQMINLHIIIHHLIKLHLHLIHNLLLGHLSHSWLAYIYMYIRSCTCTTDWINIEVLMITTKEFFAICDVFYRNRTHLGKKSKLSWLLTMKVEIFSFTMIAFLF